MMVKRQEIGSIADIFVGITAKSADVRQTGRLGNVLSVRALSASGIDVNEIVAVEIDDRDLQRYRVEAGDVILSARSTSLRTAIVPSDLAGVVINSTLLAIRCLPTLHPRLLVAFLRAPEGRTALDSVAQTGTRQMNITVNGLEKLEVPIPSLAVQQKLVRLLEAADEAYSTSVVAAADRLQLVHHLVATAMKDGEENNA